MFELIRLLSRRKRKKKKSHRQLREVPVVRRTYLADDSFVTDLIGYSKPGAKKLQFPYEIPTINTSVSLSPEVTQTLIAIPTIFSIGMVASAAIKNRK